MRPGRFDAWHAQEPPADFAERAVRRFLQQRRRGGWTPRRWFALGAIAATTVAGAAWGYSAFTAREVPAVRVAPPVEPPTPAPPPKVTAAPPPVAVAPPAPSPVLVPARPVHRPSAPPATAPDAGRRVMVPRCACDNDVLCSCL